MFTLNIVSKSFQCITLKNLVKQTNMSSIIYVELDFNMLDLKEIEIHLSVKTNFAHSLYRMKALLL